MPEIVYWDPFSFPLHRKAIEYLDLACKRSQLGVFTSEQTIRQAKDGFASIYMVMENHEVIGCFTLCLRSDGKDLYLELPLLGGKKLSQWRHELVDFLFYEAAHSKCTKFTMVGRKGFERLFPEMKLLCCVYGRNLTEGF